MFDEVKRANRIIDDLLRYTRIRKPEKIPADAVSLVKQCIDTLISGKTVPERRIRFLSDADELPGYLDPDQIRQVMMNLIENAYRYISETGVIDVNCGMMDQNILISVTDDGCGIPEDAVDHVFEPFFSTRKSGTGLGLSIAQTIVHLHGGEIAVKNLPEGGCCFTVEIPAAGYREDI